MINWRKGISGIAQFLALHTCSSPTSVLHAQSYLDMVLCLGLRLCTSSENPGRLEEGSMTSSAWTLIYQAESCWQESIMRTLVAFCELAMSEIQTQPPFQGLNGLQGSHNTHTQFSITQTRASENILDKRPHLWSSFWFQTVSGRKALGAKTCL